MHLAVQVLAVALSGLSPHRRAVGGARACCNQGPRCLPCNRARLPLRRALCGAHGLRRAGSHGSCTGARTRAEACRLRAGRRPASGERRTRRRLAATSSRSWSGRPRPRPRPMTQTPRTGTCTVRSRLPCPNLPNIHPMPALAHTAAPAMQPAAEGSAATLPAHRARAAPMRGRARARCDREAQQERP